MKRIFAALKSLNVEQFSASPTECKQSEAFENSFRESESHTAENREVVRIPKRLMSFCVKSRLDDDS
jgi:hypothetical protein